MLFQQIYYFLLNESELGSLGVDVDMLILVHSSCDEDSALHRRTFSAFAKQRSQIMCQVRQLIDILLL